jgi:tetratricopeptide (TPR) repeat protein
MNQELTTYGELNDIYNQNFDDRPFDNFEKKLFNKQINKEDFDMQIYNNANNIYSIINYYSSVEIDKVQQLKYIQKLLKFPNENRGYLKLAFYFHDQNNDEKMMECFKAGASKGNCNCISNIGAFLAQQQKYDEAIIYFKKAMELGYYRCCDFICMCYISLNDFENAYRYALYGALKEQQKCLDIIITVIDNDLKTFHVLTKLNTTSLIIQNYLNRVRPTLTKEEIADVMTTDVLLFNNYDDHTSILNIDGNVLFYSKLDPQEVDEEKVDEETKEHTR